MTDFHDPDHITIDELAETQPKKRSHVEWIAQRTDNAFLSKALPPEAYFTAIDVGRSTNAQEGQLRKLRGVKPGIPDWLIVWKGITLWVERKVSASLSPGQKVTRDALLANGHHWALARSTEQLEAACRDSGIPLRATLGEIKDRIAAQGGGAKKKSRSYRAVPRKTASKGFVLRAAAKGIRL